jgi:hypothetical protein
MTGDEGIEYMLFGGKIRFHTWWWGRYIHMDKGEVIDESGRHFPKQQVKDNSFWEEYMEYIHGEQNE